MNDGEWLFFVLVFPGRGERGRKVTRKEQGKEGGKEGREGWAYRY